MQFVFLLSFTCAYCIHWQTCTKSSITKGNEGKKEKKIVRARSFLHKHFMLHRHASCPPMIRNPPLSSFAQHQKETHRIQLKIFFEAQRKSLICSICKMYGGKKAREKPREKITRKLSKKHKKTTRKPRRKRKKTTRNHDKTTTKPRQSHNKTTEKHEKSMRKIRKNTKKYEKNLK